MFIVKPAQITYAAITLGAALWCGALVLAPVLTAQAGSPGPVGEFLYTFFHRVCHQVDDRSLHIDGRPLAVCARCASIYFGFFAATLAYLFLKRFARVASSSRWLLLLGALPMVLDVGVGLIGIHEVSNASRIVTGGLFGLASSFVLIPLIIEAVGQMLPARLFSPFITLKGPPHA